MLLTLLIVCVFFLAWANGANDNFKGVATLYGSGTTAFRKALVWATGATVAGSLVSVAFAARLVGVVEPPKPDPRGVLVFDSLGSAKGGTTWLASVTRPSRLS